VSLTRFGREELFYQLGLRQFGNFARLKLDPPAPLRALIKLAVDAEQNTELSKLSKPQIVDVRKRLRINEPRISSSLPFHAVYRAHPYLSKRHVKRVLLAGYHDGWDGRLSSCACP
jgi:predicted transposase YdaD